MRINSVFMIGACAIAGAIEVFGASGSRPDLVGRITCEDGSPLPRATVFIYSARPKYGTASVCPYCYADCRKKTETAADGGFKIESLDPELIFRLLVVARGYQSQFVTNVNPATVQPKIALKVLTEEALKSPTRITGLVIGEDGKPVVGAVVGPEGVTRGTTTHWGGTDRFVDPAAVTDDTGKFLLLCHEDVDAVHATVEGRGLAKRWIELKPGRDHLVRLQEGVTVTGLIERDSRPLKDVLVGMATTDRVAGNFLHYDELATDKDGRFVLPNVPAGREFVLYAKMDSLRSQGVLSAKVLTTGNTGTTSDVGNLKVQPGHVLSGRIALSDGMPVPPGTRVFLGREKASDHTESLLDEAGRFEFKNVPAESVGLSVRIKGYKFSKRNPSLDWLNGSIIGRVDGDLTDLTFLMEPGQWRFNGPEEEDLPPGAERQPREKPLRGAKM